MKRSEINHIVKLIPENERKKLWGMGIKNWEVSRIFTKNVKTKGSEFRIALWKLFNQKSKINEIPKSGLNFLSDRSLNKDFLLLCGFEKFKDYFVRIDILEKLFIKIIDKTKDKKFKVDTEMMNLLGCTKENFYNLMKLMNYRKDKRRLIHIYF